MQKVGVSIRLEARDIADIEAVCEVLNMTPSEWYRTVIKAALNVDYNKCFKPKEKNNAC